MSGDGGAPAGTNEEDLERLASRIAMLAGDDGEAEAAGRAVAHLTRKLGLSGGHLKLIFLAGAGRLASAARHAAEQSARADRLEGETGQLQHSLEQVDFAFRQASRERDAEQAEAARLREALDRVRNAQRVRTVLMLGVLAVLIGGVAFVALGPPLRPLLGISFDAARPGAHAAEVREHGADAYAEPDLASGVLWRLPGGVRLRVERLVWRNFNQWAEVKLGGRSCFVVVTSLDLTPDAR